MRRGALIALLVTVLVVAGLTVTIVTHGGTTDDTAADFPYCSATVDGHLAELDVEQAQNAALITSIAIQRGMPARAVSIALATAYQESDLYNLRYGDRDSLGLFQQRPSQGWGTPAELIDPVYATNAFYDALDRVDHYDQLEITVAAQEVQHSGFPGAYADHEDDARTFASALTGNSPGAFTCFLPDRGKIGSSMQVREQAVRTFATKATLVSPSGVSVRAHGRVRGWAIASYFVAQAASLHLDSVSFDGRTWTRTGGWVDAPAYGRSHVLVQPTLA